MAIITNIVITTSFSQILIILIYKVWSLRSSEVKSTEVEIHLLRIVIKDKYHWKSFLIPYNIFFTTLLQLFMNCYIHVYLPIILFPTSTYIKVISQHSNTSFTNYCESVIEDIDDIDGVERDQSQV